MRPHVQEDFEVAVHEGDPDEQTAPPEVPQLQGVRGAGRTGCDTTQPRCPRGWITTPMLPGCQPGTIQPKLPWGLRTFEVLMNPGGS